MSNLREELAQQRLGMNGRLDPKDGDAAAKWPLLYDLLTAQLAEEGKIYEPPKLTISAQNGEWVVQLVDAALAQSLTVTVGKLPRVFESLEKALSSPETHWTVWKGRKPKVGLKKMKNS